MLLDEYRVCKVCGDPLNERLAAWAVRRVEKTTCSDICREKDIIATFGCCSQAKQTPCVCLYSFTCPIHGERHVGTHD